MNEKHCYKIFISGIISVVISALVILILVSQGLSHTDIEPKVASYVLGITGSFIFFILVLSFMIHESIVLLVTKKIEDGSRKND